MPLDGTNFQIETRPDLSKPSLEGLAWLLRHPEEWPAGYRWDYAVTLFDYAGCGTDGCAWGIALLRWGKRSGDDDAGNVVTRAAKRFGISNGAARAIFMSSDGDCDDITPEVVAGRIDDHLAGRPIRYLVAGDRS